MNVFSMNSVARGASFAASYNVYTGEADVGRGVFAVRDLGPVTWILTFEGPRLSSTHPLVMDDEMGNLLQVDADTYLLPRPPGALVNHSCNPNAGILDGVHLVTLRHIAAGEEIRFDYSTTMDEDHWTMACRCGDPVCRERVEDFACLPAELQQKYLEKGIVSPFIARRYRPRDC